MDKEKDHQLALGVQICNLAIELGWAQEKSGLVEEILDVRD